MDSKIFNNNNFNKMNYHQLVTSLHGSFAKGITRNVEFRLTQLKGLLRLYEENNDLILSALKKDMRKSKLEGYLYEVDLMKNDVRGAIRNLKTWTKNTDMPRNILTPADKAYYTHEPYGVVLVLAPWNYPFQLTLVPVCGAIAAGNCVVIKPSEISFNSAETIAKLIPKYLSPECYRVVLGGPNETQLLLDEKFDYIFYTGNFNIAKEIHHKANKFLTPSTFELGGKSPAYVDNTVNFNMTAKRIMWGKCMNMGQTCVAPDFVLCSKEVEKLLLKECVKVMNEWYGNDWKMAKDLARIINNKHFNRIKKLIFETKRGKIAMGGNFDENDLWIEPSIVVDVSEEDAIMQEEIFGPVLAIYTVNSESQAINFINKRPQPLCLYVFSANEKTQMRFQTETRSGTMAFNDTIIQFAIDELPFGGVGESGNGYYHGKFSFDTFSHCKSVVKRDFSYVGDKVGMFRYPPYTPAKINFLSFVLHHWKKFKFIYFDYIPHFICFAIGVFVALFFIK